MVQPNTPQFTATAGMRNESQVMTVGEWFVTILLLSIPVVNIILALVWGFGSDGNENRANYCKALLIMVVIGAVLGLIFSVVFGAMAATTFRQS